MNISRAYDLIDLHSTGIRVGQASNWLKSKWLMTVSTKRGNLISANMNNIISFSLGECADWRTYVMINIRKFNQALI